MNTSVRRRLDAAVRIRNLGRAHPFTDPQHVEVAALFERRITEAEALLVDARTGRSNAAGAVRAARTVRRELLTHLRILARTASLATVEAPDAAAGLKAPAPNAGNRALIAAARSMVTAGRNRVDLLTRHGLSATLLDELDGLVTRFQGEVGRAVDAGIVGNEVTGRLKAVMSELGRIVRLLDAINQVRFAGDAGLLTAWNRARNVVGPPSGGPRVPEGPAGGEVAA